MHLRTRLALGLLLGGMLTLAWVAWNQSRTRVNWLTLQGPRSVNAGHPLTVLAQVDPRWAGTSLHLDLHGSDAQKQSLGFIANLGSQIVPSNHQTLSYTVQLPPRLRAHQVHVVAFLSPVAGHWRDRIQLAQSSLLPVIPTTNALPNSTPPPTAAPTLHPLKLERPLYEGPIETEPQPRWRFTAATLWLLVAIRLGFQSRTLTRSTQDSPSTTPSPSHSPRRYLLLAAACLAMAVWQSAALGHRLSDQFRQFAVAQGWYNLRTDPQQWLSLLAALALALTVTLLITRRATLGRPHPAPHLLAPLLMAASLEALNTLSWHAFDAILGTPWLGLTLFQATQIACPLVALCQSRSLRTRKPLPLPST